MSGLDCCLLSKELRTELGNEDESNRLVVTRKRRRKMKTPKKTPMERDRKAEQAEQKREHTMEMQTLYAELQEYALPPDQFLKLQQVCQKKKKKRKQRTATETDTEQTTPGQNTTTNASSTPEESMTDVKLAVVPNPDGKCTEMDHPMRQWTVHKGQDKMGEVELVPTEGTVCLPEDEMEVESLHHQWEKTVATAYDLDAIHDQTVTELSPVEGNPSTATSTEEKAAPHRVILVSRSAEVEASRSALPIIGYEQEIMEAVRHYDVVVVCGQTGCGKTTQVPQFLFEAGYGHRAFLERSGAVGVTQPRRIAATSTAARVARELGHPLGSIVGYHIRHERRLSEETSVKFITDGILLRELQSDFALMSYSALIIDEAHERSLNTDLILGMVSRVVRLRRRLRRQPLKVIIMSATLEAGTLLTNSRLFAHPPVIEVPSRQYSVTVHFAKKTEDDYEMAAMKAVIRIHRQLPPGAILVFLTGKREIDRFCVELRRRLVVTHRRFKMSPLDEVDDASSEEEVEILPGNTDDEASGAKGTCEGAVVYPLYAMLPPQRQSLVFAPVPEGRRLIVVATNVAETSITIPNVRYVVDAGRAKHKRLHPQSDVSHFVVDWISKASAIQRSGRAGRTCPGHCYRLYSSAQFGRFPEHEEPEIACVALEEVVLLMNSMGLTRVEKFPFPTVPDKAALTAAETRLRVIGAIDDDGATELGRQLVQLPIPPRQARMVFAAKKMEEEGFEGVTLYALSLASVMSVESPFLNTNQKKNKPTRLFFSTVSDSITILNAYCHYRRHPQPRVFCEEHHLHQKLMSEIASLDRQLRRLFLDHLGIKSRSFALATPCEPSTEMVDRLRRCVVAGWCDQIARKLTVEHTRRIGYQMQIQTEAEDRVYLHPLSTLRKSAPEFVVYTQATKTEERTYIHGVTKVEPEWIYAAAAPLCVVRQEALLFPGASYDVASDSVVSWNRVLYGRHDWELPPQPLPCEDPDICTAHFAVALLSGKILQSDAFEHLVMPASYAASIEARFHKRLGLLLGKLKDKFIWNRRGLTNRLSMDPDFLKNELSLWIHSDWRLVFTESWRQFLGHHREHEC